ncbi:hypothetical protein PVAND_009370 [Polypedilum vanderplanki]|uniref:Zinc finger protein n=1 Tax=Polypedilum vanderplanki TaxID=319348 RepID=A0A9J6CDB6_POLVA|nr:hypothetical protein PVAND_009370 [Polypedilum vanderplanki]
MPSFCVIDSCKRVKQFGDTVSFHKFPFQTKEIFDKWIEFVNRTSKDKTKPKKITKFSSICSQHFIESDFSGNGTNTRKFLRKYAIPSIEFPITRNFPHSQSHLQQQLHGPVQIILEEEPIPFEFCDLCRTQSNSIVDLDNFNFALMRKCLPMMNFNLSLTQRLCTDCVNILKTFSSFIDRILVAQNFMNESMVINLQQYQQQQQRQRIIIPDRNIKIEPLPYDDMIIPQIQQTIPQEVTNFQPRTSQTSQKKCEILEIVDIKQPLNFLPYQTNALNNNDINEVNDVLTEQHLPVTIDPQDDEIQILSPKQLKVEIDQDEECGDNEFEMIKNFVYISSVYNHDHNYVRELSNENVKIELDDEDSNQIRSNTPSIVSLQENHYDYLKICCKRKFKSAKRYLIHKLTVHKINAITSNIHCRVCDKKFITYKRLKFHRLFYCKQKKHPKFNLKSKRSSRKLKVKVSKTVQENSMQKPKRKQYRTKNNHRNQNNQCPICFKVFKASKNLYQHKSTHSETKYTCAFCQKSFKMRHGLKQHIAAQHEKKKQYTCTICKHNYALKGDLKRCRHSDLKRKT